MDTSFFEIAAVVVIVGVVCSVVIRAFASSRTDGLDMFMKQRTADKRNGN